MNERTKTIIKLIVSILFFIISFCLFCLSFYIALSSNSKDVIISILYGCLIGFLIDCNIISAIFINVNIDRLQARIYNI